MFYKEKFYSLINWKNRPNLSTPLGAKNLNKMDKAIGELDERVVETSKEAEKNKLSVQNLGLEIESVSKDIEEVRESTQYIDSSKIVTNKSGAPVYIDDASNMNIENIVFYGESKQNGTPTPDNPQMIEPSSVGSVSVYRKNLLKNTATSQTVNGVAFDVNDDKSIKTSGSKTGTSNVICKIGTFLAKAGIEYICSYLAPSDSEVADNYMQLHTTDFSTLKNVTTTLTLSFEEDTVLNVRMIVNSTTGKTYYPMIRPTFFTDSTYEPYQSQTVNLPEPIELNGMNGVRDSSKLKTFGVVVFDGSDDEGWGTMDTATAGVKRLFTRRTLAKASASNDSIPNILCTHYKPTTPQNTYSKVEGITVSMQPPEGGNSYMYFYDENFNTTDVSLWKAHLKANPMTVVYELAEPIETELPQADIDAIKNLHTYKPNTVVMNDGDAEMDVQYVADAKTYIDKKFEALASAIVNQ